MRSLREFDDKIVARYCGFRDADDYYYRAASARVVDRIAVPTLILRALDDPFIRLIPETRAALLANPHVAFVETPHGGHCAYLSRDPGNEIHWAEATVMRYLLQQCRRTPMEADWEVEIGGGAPVIDALWPGFVDLRAARARGRIAGGGSVSRAWRCADSAQRGRLARLDFKMRCLARRRSLIPTNWTRRREQLLARDCLLHRSVAHE